MFTLNRAAFLSMIVDGDGVYTATEGGYTVATYVIFGTHHASLSLSGSTYAIHRGEGATRVDAVRECLRWASLPRELAERFCDMAKES